jgi:uncharacterized membrane protein YedE/YeeE
LPVLILHHLRPIHWGLAGAAIAAITLFLLWTTNRRLGISTGLENLCALASRLPYFRRGELHGAGAWRLPFLLGLVLGGVLSAILGGGLGPITDAGMLDRLLGPGLAPKLLWMFAGGLLVGTGTRLSNGCTSGHGVFGLANLERASLYAVLTFFATGALVTNLIYRLLIDRDLAARLAG